MTSKHKPEDGLKELRAFIESIKLSTHGLSAPNSEMKVVYRKFYALLIYDYILQKSLQNTEHKAYAKEAVSDLSHSFFLTCIGLYKPARTSARSALENLLRLLLLNKGVDALTITSVFTLFDEANIAFSSSPSQKERIGRLRQIYQELCKTVHSSSVDYMNLEVPFNTMLQFDQDKFLGNIDIIRECSRVFGELLFVEFSQLVRTSHHTHRDLLSDSVSRIVRKEVSENSEASSLKTKG